MHPQWTQVMQYNIIQQKCTTNMGHLLANLTHARPMKLHWPQVISAFFMMLSLRRRVLHDPKPQLHTFRNYRLSGGKNHQAGDECCTELLPIHGGPWALAHGLTPHTDWIWCPMALGDTELNRAQRRKGSCLFSYSYVQEQPFHVGFLRLFLSLCSEKTGKASWGFEKIAC